MTRPLQHVEVEHRYSATPAEVWGVYTDHAGWSGWAGVPGSRLLIPGRADPNGVGSVRELGRWPITSREEVIDFEPPRRMTYRLVGGAIRLRDHLGEVVIEPDGDGTRLVWRCHFRAPLPGLGGFLRAGIELFFRRALIGLERRHFPG